MNVLLLGAVVWFAVAVLLAVGVGRVLALADANQPDIGTGVDLDDTQPTTAIHVVEPIPYLVSEQFERDVLQSLIMGNDGWDGLDELQLRRYQRSGS